MRAVITAKYQSADPQTTTSERKQPAHVIVAIDPSRAGSLTLSTSNLVNGNSLFLYNHTQINRFWMTDVTLQISSFKDQFGTQTKQLMPLLRGTYRLRERFTIDADLGYQKIEFSGPQGSSTTTRFFTSAGGRWDF